jgi:hypothetical protein
MEKLIVKIVNSSSPHLPLIASLPLPAEPYQRLVIFDVYPNFGFVGHTPKFIQIQNLADFYQFSGIS